MGRYRGTFRSTFVSEVQIGLSKLGTITPKSSCNSLDLGKLVKSFTLNHLEISEKLEPVKAELVIPDNNDYENPLYFVPGLLPVGIPCQIILHNVPSERKLWLRITLDNMTSQFIFWISFPWEAVTRLEILHILFHSIETPKASHFIART